MKTRRNTTKKNTHQPGDLVMLRYPAGTVLPVIYVEGVRRSSSLHKIWGLDPDVEYCLLCVRGRMVIYLERWIFAE